MLIPDYAAPYPVYGQLIPPPPHDAMAVWNLGAKSADVEAAVNLAAAGFGMVLLATTPALSVGFVTATVPDPDGPALEAGIWYPSDAPAAPQRLGLFTQIVATGGDIAGRSLPLVVISHGTGGSFGDHHDTALALAEAGFVVAAVTHTGDNFRDQSGIGQIENRPRHIKALIDYMLASWPQRERLDPARTGIFGFSAGGFTALVAIGGVPDLSRSRSHCAAHPEDWGCRRARETGKTIFAAPEAFVHDPRIVAAVIAAPAIGTAFTPADLAGIKVPIQLWRGDTDEILPHPWHAQNVYDGLPVKPDYRVVPNAGHFAFLTPCTPALASIVPAICRDPAGFDRAVFHREFNPAVVAFFKAKLGP
jgi:predicted dienelactone hydrolase